MRIFKMAVSGDGHEDVGDGEQQDCLQGPPFRICPEMLFLASLPLVSYFRRTGFALSTLGNPQTEGYRYQNRRAIGYSEKRAYCSAVSCVLLSG